MSSINNRRSRNDRPLVEWIVGGLACAAIAGLIGFLVFQALAGNASPPRLSVTVEAIERDGIGAVVRIAVRNHGDRAAAGVAVHAADGGTETGAACRQAKGRGMRHGPCKRSSSPPLAGGGAAAA